MKIKIVLELEGKKIELSPEAARSLFDSLKTVLNEPAPYVPYPSWPYYYYPPSQPWTYTIGDSSGTTTTSNFDTTGEQDA